MDNFDLKKYLAEGKLLKEKITWDIDAYDDAADVSDAADDFLPEVKRLIQLEIGDIDEDELEIYIEIANDYYHREARENAKGSDPEDISITADKFAENVIMAYQDDNEDIEDEVKKKDEPKSLTPHKEEETHLAVEYGNSYDDEVIINVGEKYLGDNFWDDDYEFIPGVDYKGKQIEPYSLVFPELPSAITDRIKSKDNELGITIDRRDLNKIVNRLGGSNWGNVLGINK